MTKKTMLIIMDGFGMPKDLSRSGILNENTTNLQSIAKKFCATTIKASEEFVGLPKGQAGTSEVGHMTIGSGRVTYQPLVKINMQIDSGKFFEQKELTKAIEYAKTNHKKIHLLGLCSDGGIHSHISHLFALVKLCKDQNFFDVFVHFVADGRDTPPKSAKKYLTQVQNFLQKEKCGKIASIVGRFYALDRDRNWDRNQKAYNLWVNAEGKKFEDFNFAIDEAYKNGETDEFLKPIVLVQDCKPISTIAEGDVVISFNFRADRERQLAYVMAEENSLDFVKPLNLYFVTMTEYDENFKNVHVVFKTEGAKDILSEVISNNGLKQLKIAETEKYAHLTFFFNYGKQDTFAGEDRILINSEKMASYADCPEMGAKQIEKKVLEVMKNYDFVAINFANTDMVGHSGVKSAARVATKVVDECVGNVVGEFLKLGGQGIITADHGNADIMEYENGTPHTAHTKAVVPLIVFGSGFEHAKLKDGGTLADIAPTLLEMMNIQKPSAMTGKSLIEK